MATIDPVTSTIEKTEYAPMSTAKPATPRRRARRTPATWVRGGGLASLLFLLPTLLIFGAFSWYPIVRTVIMSLQHTNLVTRRPGSGCTTSPR